MLLNTEKLFPSLGNYRTHLGVKSSLPEKSLAIFLIISVNLLIQAKSRMIFRMFNELLVIMGIVVAVVVMAVIVLFHLYYVLGFLKQFLINQFICFS